MCALENPFSLKGYEVIVWYGRKKEYEDLTTEHELDIAKYVSSFCCQGLQYI